MIRFVVQCHEFDFNCGMERKTIHTVDREIPELEEMLSRGGRGEMGFESWQLLGAELIPQEPK